MAGDDRHGAAGRVIGGTMHVGTVGDDGSSAAHAHFVMAVISGMAKLSFVMQLVEREDYCPFAA